MIRKLLLLALGVPCGMLAFKIGEKLAKKTRNPTLQGLAQGTPLAIIFILVVIIDNIL